MKWGEGRAVAFSCDRKFLEHYEALSPTGLTRLSPAQQVVDIEARLTIPS